jgi:DNA-binding MarR family transcriptional regulator
VSTTKLAESLMTNVMGLRRVIRRQLTPQLFGTRLRGAQVELLRIVEKEPGIGVAAAAKALHMAGNSVSTLVNQLVETGMLERRVDPADRRAARLDLTETARARLANWRRARTEYVAGALDQLSKEDIKAIEAALPALNRLLEAL